jgi:copper(I)-binding protein
MTHFPPVIRMWRRLAPLAVAIGLALAPTLRAAADESFEPLSGVTIEDASITVARVGETARLSMRIDNASGRKITLLGVRAEIADSGALIVAPPGAAQQDAQSFVLLDQETLDLGSSHIGAELRGLRRPIHPGETVEFELIFAVGAVKAIAHAH